MIDAPLYSMVWSWENLLLAYRKASKGKREKAPAAAFEYRLEDNLVALETELREKTYRPGPYDSFCIHDPRDGSSVPPRSGTVWSTTPSVM